MKYQITVDIENLPDVISCCSRKDNNTYNVNITVEDSEDFSSEYITTVYTNEFDLERFNKYGYNIKEEDILNKEYE